MPTYPSYEQAQDSEATELDGLVNDTADNGTLYARSFWPSAKLQFSIVHVNLSPSQLATIRTFKETNKKIPFSFVWKDDTVTYTVMYLSGTLKWKRTSNLNGGSYRVEIALRQT
jgi:hypothetical protein